MNKETSRYFKLSYSFFSILRVYLLLIYGGNEPQSETWWTVFWQFPVFHVIKSVLLSVNGTLYFQLSWLGSHYLSSLPVLQPSNYIQSPPFQQKLETWSEYNPCSGLSHSAPKWSNSWIWTLKVAVILVKFLSLIHCSYWYFSQIIFLASLSARGISVRTPIWQKNQVILQQICLSDWTSGLNIIKLFTDVI